MGVAGKQLFFWQKGRTTWDELAAVVAPIVVWAFLKKILSSRPNNGNKKKLGLVW